MDQYDEVQSEQLGGWASVVMVVGPESKMPLVIDLDKGPPSFRKFPGGKKENGELPIETAIREVKEETGLTIENVHLIKVEQRTSHKLYFFMAEVDSFDELLDIGDEGEIVETHTIEEVVKSIQYRENFFFPPHVNLLEDGLNRFGLSY